MTEDDSISSATDAVSADGAAEPSANGRVIPAIEFRGVELAFDDQVILDGIDFMVRRGETKIVLGGSGSGKSTIINLILGLIKSDAGMILVDGEDITQMDDAELMRIRRKIGITELNS